MIPRLPDLPRSSGARSKLPAVLGAALLALLAACGSQRQAAPEPAAPPPPTRLPPPRTAPSTVPAPSATAPAPAPAPTAAPTARNVPGASDPSPAGVTRANLPPMPAVRNWDDFKVQAARRLVAAHPSTTYMGRPPEMLFGIPVIEVELNADGSVRKIDVLRRPADPDAHDTVQLAINAIYRAAPYGDVSRLPQPWKWTEVFLFNEKRQFKPRVLDAGQ